MRIGRIFILALVLTLIAVPIALAQGGAAMSLPGDWAAFLAYVSAFVSDPRFLTVAGLILLDIGFGLAEAIKTGTYEWRKVAKFLQTMVAPYLFAYLVLHAGLKLIAGGLMEGIPVEALSAALWAFIVTTLWSSIMAHWVALGLPATESMRASYKR